MYGREQRALLRHYLERGLSKAETARERGVSRRTVHHRIATVQLDRELVADRARPAAAADPVVRFEIAPGQQAQVNFAEFRAALGQALCAGFRADLGPVNATCA